jgi:5-methylcytosine-specific restriction endonuclease McrA
MASAVDNGTSSRWSKIRQRILRRDSYCCQQCGQDQGKLHVDHIVPRRLGGSDNDDNLQVLCQKCNLSKGGRFFSIGKTPPTLHDLNIPENVSVSHD